MLEQIADLLEDQAYWMRDNDLPETDIRLQLQPDGSWNLHSGDASYDTDHSGYWGAVVLDAYDYDAMGLASELIEQAEEHRAQCEG